MTPNGTPIEQRVASIGEIRDLVGGDPDLSESQIEAIENATDEEIAEALKENWRGVVEDLFNSSRDLLRMHTVDYLTGLYEERQER